jgi:hypothetical protein
MFGCNWIKEVYFQTAANRRLSGVSWSIIAPPFIGTEPHPSTRSHAAACLCMAGIAEVSGEIEVEPTEQGNPINLCSLALELSRIYGSVLVVV